MINVIGLGYIGLPTALMLASHGVDVVGTDNNKELVKTLNAGELTFKEDGIDVLFDIAKKNGINFSEEYQATDTYIVAVPTPYDKNTKKVDIRYVDTAISEILNVCEKGAIIVIESTVSPGTIDKHIRPIIRERGFAIGTDVHLVHAPERIIPGNMIYELLHNNRTIGADDKHIAEKVKDYYKSFCKGDMVLTDIKTAEMSKVVENTYRAVNIAFANELAKICRFDDMDVYEIIRICNMHPRVNILQPGPGVGGHCIPIDPWFLVGDYPAITDVISKAMQVNESMPNYVLDRMSEIMLRNNIKDISRVGLYGLTYKENVDDYRESPTIQLLELFKTKDMGPIKTYDPYINDNIVENQYHNFDEFLNEIDFVIIMVNHNEIKENQNKLLGKIVLDTRKVCDLQGTYYL